MSETKKLGTCGRCGAPCYLGQRGDEIAIVSKKVLFHLGCWKGTPRAKQGSLWRALR